MLPCPIQWVYNGGGLQLVIYPTLFEPNSLPSVNKNSLAEKSRVQKKKEGAVSSEKQHKNWKIVKQRWPGLIQDVESFLRKFL